MPKLTTWLSWQRECLPTLAQEGDVFAESTFAKQIALAEEGVIKPVIKVNLKSMRTISDVRDAVRAIIFFLHKSIKGEYYNIGGSYSCEIGKIWRFN